MISDEKDRASILLKEYELAAVRYENIYKAIWQNFNYLVLLSAGVAALGQRLLSDGYLQAAVTFLPLVFWYISIYVPMDSYARGARKRAGEIETALNETALSGSGLQMSHYRSFGDAHPQMHFGGKGRIGWFHVSTTVNFVGIGLILATAILLIMGACRKAPPPQQDALTGVLQLRMAQPESDSAQFTEVRRSLEEIRATGAALEARVRTIDSLLRSK